ncbi:hypothetical protein BT93_E1451 [Corymbia citriodora subsp. variegata]|nr:hypothetical protein BT93_E1451 [Corymbia citriodora subsp. variegata]
MKVPVSLTSYGPKLILTLLAACLSAFCFNLLCFVLLEEERLFCSVI